MTNPADFTEALSVLRSAIGRETEVQTLMTLMMVAAGDQKVGVPMADIQAALGVATSTMSRNIGLLGPHGYSGRPGLGLVRNVENPMDRRQKNVFITAQGASLVKKALAKIK